MYKKLLLFLLLTSVAAQPNMSTDICPVCLEDLALVPSTVTLECAHPLCLQCYTGIYRSQREPSCPLCRMPCTASPEQLQASGAARRRPAAPTPRPTPVAPLQPRNGGSNGATAPPPLDDNDGWESIPPEFLRPPIQQPVSTRRPCTPTPRPPTPRPPSSPATTASPDAPEALDLQTVWSIIRIIFYFIDSCMRPRR